MNLTKGVIIRSVAIVLLSAICLGSVLYVDGVFEFSFIDRHRIEIPSDVTTEHPKETTPFVTDGTTSPEETTNGESYETNGETSSNEVSSGDTESTDVPDSSGSNGSGYSPLGVTEYLNQGYKLTYSDYSSKTVLAEITLPAKYQNLYFGSKFFRESVQAHLYSDETFPFGDFAMKETNRFNVEAYMGYILISSDTLISVYDYTGTLLFETTEKLSPAYTRDKSDRPLYFISGEVKFYYIDFEQKLLVEAVDYNDKYDGRGLYFNYNPSFGKSDNNYQVSYQDTEYFRYFTMDMGESYHRLNVPPIIAKDLLLMYPKYAELVAKSNERFAVALAIAKAEVEEEEKRKEESLKAEATATENPPAPPADPLPESPTAETDNREPSEVTVNEETSSPESSNGPESTNGPESSSAESTESNSGYDTESESASDGSSENESLTSPESGESTDESTSEEIPTEPNVTEELTDPPTEPPVTEPVTEPPAVETTSKYPSNETTGYITISKYFYEPRFGYVRGDKVVKGYEYARAFAFNGGRAAVVDDDGRLAFLNTSFGRSIWLKRSFKEEIPEGSGRYVWFIKSLYEPVLKDFSSIGSYYFDEGFVTVRRVSIESMRNKRTGVDETILIDSAGYQVNPPAGFRFVSCTEGIMLVEKDGRYGYYDIKNEAWLTNPIYTYAEPFYEGMAVVGEDGKFGTIDKEGKEVLPIKFDYVSTMSTGMISTFSNAEGWRVFAKMSK